MLFGPHEEEGQFFLFFLLFSLVVVVCVSEFFVGVGGFGLLTCLFGQRTKKRKQDLSQKKRKNEGKKEGHLLLRPRDWELLLWSGASHEAPSNQDGSQLDG